MKVSVIQSGGPLGVPQRFELDSQHLSKEDADELARRSQAVAPVPEPEREYPGELGYSVEIDDDAAGGVQASYVDASMPDDVRRLVTWILDHPRRTRPG